MTVREMIGFDEAEIKTETEAAKNRVRKLMDDINEMPAGKAEKNCPYYKPEDEDDSERCENLLALFCKLDDGPLKNCGKNHKKIGQPMPGSAGNRLYFLQNFAYCIL